MNDLSEMYEKLRTIDAALERCQQVAHAFEALVIHVDATHGVCADCVRVIREHLPAEVRT